MKKLPCCLLAALLSSSPVSAATADTGDATDFPISTVDPQAVSQTGTFSTAAGYFLLNGDPVTVKAAELHYPRIPRPYWEHRIKMCKALGMNAVCLYVFWNTHEEQPGEFNFEGQNDLREFVELCQRNDMMVILRPGPYVCAEWEMGGLPWWLLRKKDIALRDNDPYFLERVGTFMEKVAGQVGDLTIDKGGPIVMVQVENEYGSYGINKEYVGRIRDMVRRNFGDKVQLFQCDWSSNFTDNGLDDLLWTMNFGTGADIDREFARLRQLRPDSPLMCSEFWSGWFDKWGANHETRPADDMIAGIDSMLSKNISFSLYMTHGGTNWGHWAGANSPGFAPDVTSYDYDAPVNEWGRPTEKYWKLRELMTHHNDGDSLLPVPEMIPVGKITRFRLDSVAPLFEELLTAGQPVDTLPTMEEMNQGFGSILYTTILGDNSAGGATLNITDVHDFAQIWIDGVYIGKLDRRLGETALTLPAWKAEARLDILVEAMGRINFGRAIKDFKGITGGVELILPDGKTQTPDGWTVALIPDREDFYLDRCFYPLKKMEGKNPALRLFTTPGDRVPGIYRGTFNIDRPADTFLDFSTWGKGLVYVNGHPLGRFWEIGPQQTLYMPGCWLRDGENEITVLDIIGPREPVVEGLDQPVLDRLSGQVLNNDPAMRPKLDGIAPTLSGQLQPGNGWQTVKFPAYATGRHLCIELLDSHDGKDQAAIAELHLLDADGNRLPRENWKARYADSENTDGNHTLDKAFDLQESTYWSTTAGLPYPHLLVIDLGATTAATALQLLPRMEAGAPAAPCRFRVWFIN